MRMTSDRFHGYKTHDYKNHWLLAGYKKVSLPIDKKFNAAHERLSFTYQQLQKEWSRYSPIGWHQQREVWRRFFNWERIVETNTTSATTVLVSESIISHHFHNLNKKLYSSDHLQGIRLRLISEDQQTRPVRRFLMAMDIFKKVLIELFIDMHCFFFNRLMGKLYRRT